MVKVRVANANDAATVHHLICELARYEKLLDEVTATVDQIKTSLFEGKPEAEVAIAQWQDKPIGFVLFFHNYSTFLASPGIYIEDIFVKPDFRGKRAGEALMKYVATLALERGCKRIDWAVLHWNKPSMDFFARMGAKKMDDWKPHRIEEDGIRNLANS